MCLKLTKDWKEKTNWFKQGEIDDRYKKTF